MLLNLAKQALSIFCLTTQMQFRNKEGKEVTSPEILEHFSKSPMQLENTNSDRF